MKTKEQAVEAAKKAEAKLRAISQTRRPTDKEAKEAIDAYAEAAAAIAKDGGK